MSEFPYRAVLFDLDGVLTSTAALHAECWKRTFEEALAQPFDHRRDYLAHLDGRPRRDGVRALLAARGIAPEPALVTRIADRKQALVQAALDAGRVEAFPGSMRWVRRLREDGVATAVVSASANARAVLRAARMDALFDVTIDGADVARLGLRGKPAPDGFLAAATRLGVRPIEAVVVEDAMAGVRAGADGAFGLVVGVARTAAPAELRAAGADMVVEDLAEMLA
jgi:alpha,alpha-trehalose phosphorylase